jgi:hypothetical protein
MPSQAACGLENCLCLYCASIDFEAEPELRTSQRTGGLWLLISRGRSRKGGIEEFSRPSRRRRHLSGASACKKESNSGTKCVFMRNIVSFRAHHNQCIIVEVKVKSSQPVLHLALATSPDTAAQVRLALRTSRSFICDEEEMHGRKCTE